MKLLRHIRFSLCTLLVFVLLIGSGMGLWRKWEPWVLVNTLRTAAATVSSAFSSDGLTYATGDADGNIVIWSGLDCRILSEWKAHSGPVPCLKFSPDGDYLITGGEDCVVRKWSLKAPKEARCMVVIQHTEPVTGVALSPDGTEVATTVLDHCVRVWSIADGELLLTLESEQKGNFLYSVAYSPDGKKLVCLSDGGQVHVFDRIARLRIATWYCDGISEWERTYVGGPVVPQVSAFTTDGSQIVTADSNDNIRVWTLTGAPVACYEQPYGVLRPSRVRPFSPDNGSFATGNHGYMPYLHSPKGVEVSPYRPPACAAPDEKSVVCPGFETELWRRRHPEYWWGVAWLPEFWLTVVFAGAFVWSIWRDRGTLKPQTRSDERR